MGRKLLDHFVMSKRLRPSSIWRLIISETRWISARLWRPTNDSLTLDLMPPKIKSPSTMENRLWALSTWAWWKNRLASTLTQSEISVFLAIILYRALAMSVNQTLQSSPSRENRHQFPTKIFYCLGGGVNNESDNVGRKKINWKKKSMKEFAGFVNKAMYHVRDVRPNNRTDAFSVN